MNKETKTNDALLFKRGGINFAIPLLFIFKVIEAQEITPVNTDNILIKGVINYHGNIIPVISINSKFSNKEKALTAKDKLVIIQQKDSLYAIITDKDVDLLTIDETQLAKTENIFPGVEYFQTIQTDKEGIIYIFDPDTFFKNHDLIDINKAISAAQ